MIEVTLKATSVAEFQTMLRGLLGDVTIATGVAAASKGDQAKADVKPKEETKAKAETKAEKPKEDAKVAEAAGVDFDTDIAAKITQLATAGYRDRIIDVLKPYGVERASLVEKADLPALAAALVEATSDL